jgi:hypothetical protein
MSYSIEKLSHRDNRWMQFINTRPEANIFHHPDWLDNLEQCYQYQTFIVALVDENRQIFAGVPMAEVKSELTGRRWVSLPFSDYCPPLAENDVVLNALTDGLIALSKEPGVPNIELRWEYPLRSEITATQENVLHVGQFYKNTEEEVFSQFRQKIRYCIRTTKERGVNVEMGTSREFLRKFYDLQCYTRYRHGVPVQPWYYFEKLGQNVLEKGLGYVLLAYADGDCVAGEIFLFFQRTITMKYGASGAVNLTNLHPNYLLDWEVIKWGRAHGYQFYDAGRSAIENEGLRHYKNKWGYIEQPLIYSHLGSIPRKGNKLSGVMHTVIRHSPIWVCRVAGDLLYKHVG